MSLDRTIGTTLQGVVFRKSQGAYSVHTEYGDVICTISSLLRKELVYPIAAPTSIRPHVMSVNKIPEVDPVAIGDRVEVMDAGPGSGMILHVLPRNNRWVRRAAGREPLEQVIVANVDQVVAVMAAAEPPPKWELLDRYLVAAEAAELPAIICLTKADLIRGDEQMDVELSAFESLGYRVIRSSSMTGEGIEETRAALRDRVSVLVGKSGVGKSSLLNALQPGLGLRVREISDHTGKGKHTTSHLEMFDLHWGGRVVDTPGMREFALWKIPPTLLPSLFPEMRPYLGLCQFRADCTHSHEPGCAVKRAVSDRRITERRYNSYLRLRR